MRVKITLNGKSDLVTSGLHTTLSIILTKPNQHIMKLQSNMVFDIEEGVLLSSKKDLKFFWASGLLTDFLSTWNKDERLFHPIKARERCDKQNYIGMVNIYFIDNQIIPTFVEEVRGVLLKVL
ncbi:MAG: hypothetical protein ACW976_05970, partial [Candidatus Ranarchaeia archaeon]